MESWRKFGPLGRLHNVAVKIHASPQLYYQFLGISRGKTLPRDNSTRWLSWAKTIARAIELRGPIDQFFDLVMEETSDKLSEEDWETLKIVSDLLVFSLALNTPANMTSMERSLRS